MLPAIPLLHATGQEEPGVLSARAAPDRLALLIRLARRHYTPAGVALADGRSRAWSACSASPYAGAVPAVAAAAGRPGAFLLNYSFEWGCTAGVAEREDGPTLLRTLDWPFPGLGGAVVVVAQHGPAGGYHAITWPGYVGVLTGTAVGRFAAAINQPPLPLPGWGRAGGWVAARWRTGRSHAMPPSHLLRLAFDSCAGFAEAVALLLREPICQPAIFTVAGTRPGEAAVIERTQHAGFVSPVPAAANHWSCAGSPAGRPRNRSSVPRRAAMAGLLGRGGPDTLGWLVPPILQPDTRLAVLATPATGRLLVQGWDAMRPVTRPFDLPGREAG